MRYLEFSMPFGLGEASLLRESRFWIAQLAGWLLINPLYFRGPIEWGIAEGLVPLSVAMTLTGWAAAVACSSALAPAYLRMPNRWLTGVRAIPVVLGLSLLAALPWASIMTLLVASATSIPPDWRQNYGPWMFFHASLLMVVWSGAFLWFVRARSAAPAPRTAGATAPWSPSNRVCLEERKRVTFCLVQDIAYIRAAGDYTEVHLASGEVAVVTQRLRYWQSQLPESFVRIHRSTLINLDLTEELAKANGSWRVRLRGCPEPLSVSRRLEQAVKAKIVAQKRRLSP